MVGDAEAIADAFSEIADLADGCRFRDCSHQVEPGCAVLAAVEDGTLDERRLDSWRKLLREAAYQQRRTDARAAAAERDVWKRREKAVRTHYKLRGRKRWRGPRSGVAAASRGVYSESVRFVPVGFCPSRKGGVRSIDTLLIVLSNVDEQLE